MLLITCPWCGDRAQTEFTYRGDATVERPAPSDSKEDWYDFVHTRDNPRGEHVEWWHHTAGCRKWFKVRRNTWTHEVIDSAPPVSDEQDSLES